MKIVALVARLLLGLIFAFFGANLMFHFLPNPPMPPGPLKDFNTILFTTHYVEVVGFFQFLGGVLLLLNLYVAVGLIILAAIIVNILTTHILVMHGAGLIPAPLVVVLLWLIVFYRVRGAFAGVFQPKVGA